MQWKSFPSAGLLALFAGVLSAGFGTGKLLGEPAGDDREAAQVASSLEVAHRLSDAYQEISRRVGPSVVSVLAYERFGSRLRRTNQGSGVVVRSSGFVVTSNHVIEKAEEVRVYASDGRRWVAEVVGTDRESDLAVLSVDASGLPAAELAQDEPQTGEMVLAMGNPLGLGHTVTSGIISGKGRANLGIAVYEEFLQTDAAINPGNSGGALIDLDGRVVGIVTGTGDRDYGTLGIGFVIPSRVVSRVVDDLLSDGRVRRGWLGINILPISEEAALTMGYDGASRVAVGEVFGGSPAATAGLERGDVVVRIGERGVTSTQELMSAIAAVEPGQRVTVEVWRGERLLELPVTLAERDPDSLR